MIRKRILGTVLGDEDPTATGRSGRMALAILLQFDFALARQLCFRRFVAGFGSWFLFSARG